MNENPPRRRSPLRIYLAVIMTINALLLAVILGVLIFTGIVAMQEVKKVNARIDGFNGQVDSLSKKIDDFNASVTKLNPFN